MGSTVCFAYAIQANLDPGTFCVDSPTPVAPAVVTPGLVASALRTTPLPASELVIEPPNGRTLVNLATNFYTVQPSFTRVLNLLGQRVELRIRPVAFTWHFAPDAEATTTSPGARYPKLDVTHTYLERGRVSPSVDTTYGADFRVGSGAWQPVPGSVTIAGAPVSLQVLEATPRLVG